MVIDAHCHLDDEMICNKEMFDKIEKDKDLVACVSLGTDIKSSCANVELAKQNQKIYVAVGVHPECVSLWEGEKTLNKLAELAKNEKVVAIGEIGLDYHYTTNNISLQKEVFISQIKLAYKLKLPICIHCRDAVIDVYEILNKYRDYLKYGVVMHCYCEGTEWMERFNELGVYFSFAGNFTYKSFDKEVVKFIRTDKILIETDSPYLAPVPKRGQVNNPTNVVFVAQEIAKTLNKPFKEICEITSRNAIKFYNLKI